MSGEQTFSPEQLDGSWVCHACLAMGTEAEATAHHIVTGHEVESLNDALKRGAIELVAQS